MHEERQLFYERLSPDVRCACSQRRLPLGIQMLTLAATSTRDPRYRVCQPSANASATELAASLSKEVKQIVAWLKAHPDLADLQDVNSVIAAVQAIYPCH